MHEEGWRSGGGDGGGAGRGTGRGRGREGERAEAGAGGWRKVKWKNGRLAGIHVHQITEKRVSIRRVFVKHDRYEVVYVPGERKERPFGGRKAEGQGAG